MKVKKDTLDKIIEVYVAAVATEPFTYKGKKFEVRTLRVSPGVSRGFICPPSCGGCCHKFSLDYLPNTVFTHPKQDCGNYVFRTIDFNGKEIEFLTDTQEDNDGAKCRHLNMETGRCGVHGEQPFSCDFELLRFSFSNNSLNTNFTTRLFGRGWAMQRIDGDRGAKCEITPSNKESILDTIRKINLLGEWCDHLEIKHRCSQIVSWLKLTGGEKPLVFLADDPDNILIGPGKE